MNEERESRLTAFALNDPGISASERQEIEALMASDSAAKQAVEETRQLARMLSDGLAAEQAATVVAKAVTIPAKANRKNSVWIQRVAAVAAVSVVAGGATAVVWSKWRGEQKPNEQQLVADLGRPQGSTTSHGNSGASFHSGLDWSRPLNEGASPEEATATNAFVVDEKKSLSSGTAHASSAGLGGYRGAGAGISPGGIAGPGGPGIPGPSVPGKFGGGGRPAGSGLAGGAIDGKPDHRVPVMPVIPADSKREVRAPVDMPKSDPDTGEPTGRDRHPQFVENPFIKVEGQNALSTFGVDVDTASYSIVRRYLTEGQLPPADAIRLEEMVNYFPYADKPPEGADPFAVTAEMAECPWQPAHRLVRLGLKAKPIPNEKRPPSNLVFLIDVSGSMMTPERLPLVKASLKLLVGQLREKDQVSLVAYAGNSGLVLDSTNAKDRIVEALDRLEAGGSTHGSQGIEQAYEVAEAHFIKNGTNRVILCTDGDWNVGVTSTEALVKLIEKKRDSGVFLSVFGFGFGNLRDEMLVKLSGKGNGNYAYIDTLKEGHKVFVEQLGGTLVTVAKDVKIQVEFNPAVIKSYRLLGYEKRLLAAKDFHDDKVDSGEMGAGHVVTALYELVPVGAPDPIVGKVDPLRYQKEPEPKVAVKGDKNEAFLLKMRHKKPDSDTSTLREMPVLDVTKEYSKASEDFQFSAAVASFAMLLRDSQFKGSSNYGLVLELAQSAMSHDPSGYRAEFIELVKKAKLLAGK